MEVFEKKNKRRPLWPLEKERKSCSRQSGDEGGASSGDSVRDGGNQGGVACIPGQCAISDDRNRGWAGC